MEKDLVVGPNGGYIIKEEDRRAFELINELEGETWAVEAATGDILGRIEGLQKRLEITKNLKNRLKRQQTELEFQVFPKYKMKMGQVFTTKEWELLGVGPDETKPEK